jgi:flagellar basal-body rod modification protein FlgD
MTGIAGLLNHATGTLNPLANARPMGTTQSASGTSAGDASTVSANDFLTLLVTEMKNQDPTANTDPNEYINQLVQVNSLEQLIDINQNLSTALGPGSASGDSVTGHAVSSPHAVKSGAGTAAPASSARKTRGMSSASPEPISHSKTVPVAAGNLGVPRMAPAAHRVAQALSGTNEFVRAQLQL